MIRAKTKNLGAIICLGIFFLLVSNYPSLALTYTFNVVSGNWNTAANWSPAGIPGSADKAIINNGGTCTINSSVSLATLGGLSGGAVTIDGSTLNLATGGSFTIGDGDDLLTIQNNGTLSIASGLTLSLNGGFYFNSGILDLQAGTGQLVINAQATNNFTADHVLKIRYGGGTTIQGGGKIILINPGLNAIYNDVDVDYFSPTYYAGGGNGNWTLCFGDGASTLAGNAAKKGFTLNMSGWNAGQFEPEGCFNIIEVNNPSGSSLTNRNVTLLSHLRTNRLLLTSTGASNTGYFDVNGKWIYFSDRSNTGTMNFLSGSGTIDASIVNSRLWFRASSNNLQLGCNFKNGHVRSFVMDQNITILNPITVSDTFYFRGDNIFLFKSGAGDLTMGCSGCPNSPANNVGFTIIRDGYTAGTFNFRPNYTSGVRHNVTYLGKNFNVTTAPYNQYNEFPAPVISGGITTYTITGTFTFNSGFQFLDLATTGFSLTVGKLVLKLGIIANSNTSNLKFTITGVPASVGGPGPQPDDVLGGSSLNDVIGGSSSSYIEGSVYRYLPASNAGTGFYVFPLGDNRRYNPIFVQNPTTGAAPVLMKAAFLAFSGGTYDASLDGLKTDRFWDMSVISGTLTSTNIGIYSELIDPNTVLANSTFSGGVFSLLTGGSTDYYKNLGGATNNYQYCITSSPIAFPANNIFRLGYKNCACTQGGTYHVGNSQTLKNLTDVTAKIQTCRLTSNTNFVLDADYNGTAGETFPIVFNQAGQTFSGGIPSNYQISIYPNAGVSPVTSGDPGVDSLPLINLNGIDYLTLDGRQNASGSTVSWTIRNTRSVIPVPKSWDNINGLNKYSSSGAGPVIALYHATNNTLTYLKVEGETQYEWYGLILFGLSDGFQPSNNNTISNCIIRDRTDIIGYPRNGIMITQSQLINLTGTTITNNEFINIRPTTKLDDLGNAGNGSTSGFSAAIAVREPNYAVQQNIADLSITNNHYYHTTPVGCAAPNGTATPIKDARLYFLFTEYKLGPPLDLRCTSNYIGGSAKNCGGAPMIISSCEAQGNYNQPAFSFGGVFITGCTNASIKNNFIQNISITSNHNNPDNIGTNFIGYYVGYTIGNYNIEGNTIGNITGTNSINITDNGGISWTDMEMKGIYVNNYFNTSSPLGNTIRGNKMGAITFSSPYNGVAAAFVGKAIEVNSNLNTALTIPIDSNIIGSPTVNNSIQASSVNAAVSIDGIYIGNSGNSNTIPNIGVIYGNSLSNWTISSAINNQNGYDSYMRGIVHLNDQTATIKNNLIFNLSNGSDNNYSNELSAISGICLKPNNSNANIISSNTIYSLKSTNSTAATMVNGIYTATSTNNIVERNLIHSFESGAANASAVQVGLNINNNGTYRNNMVRFGHKHDGAGGVDGTDISTPTNMYGILEASAIGSTNKIYHNSVYIGGTGVAGGAGKSAAYYCNVFNKNDLDVRNNIFLNVRSGTGNHASVILNIDIANPPVYSATNMMDYNIYSRTVPAPANTNQPMISSLDNGVTFKNSFQALRYLHWGHHLNSGIALNAGLGNINFINPKFGASSAIKDLRIQSPSPADSAGFNLSAFANADYFANVRSALSPHDIGAHAINSLASPIDIFTPSATITSAVPTCSDNITNKTITAAITDNGTGIPAAGGNSPRLWYKAKYGNGMWVSVQGLRTSGGSLSNGTYKGTSNWEFQMNYALSGWNSAGRTLADPNIMYYYVVMQDSLTPAYSGPNVWYTPFDDIGPHHSSVNTQLIEPSIGTKTNYSLPECDLPLPVTWLSFDASISLKDVLLNWRTAREDKNDEFIIERSFDGKSFEPIGKLDGAGTSNHTLSYSFLDKGVAYKGGPNIYYKVKQIDQNEHFSYTPLRSVSFGDEEFGISTIFPNPFKETLEIDFFAPFETELEITIEDILGRQVLSNIKKLTKGGNKIILNGLENFVPGVYFIEFKYDGKLITERIIKQ